jgi:hypothetical protein
MNDHPNATYAISPVNRAMIFRLGGVVIVGLAVLLGSGCASITPYKERSDYAVNLLTSGRPAAAAEAFSRDARRYSGRNEGLLWELEAGKAWQFAADWQNSRQWFDQAEVALRSFEDEAVIVVRDGLAETTALVTNQTAIPFRGDGIDPVWVNVYQALNYLMLGELEGAAVESRRALIRQEKLADYYAAELAAAREAGRQAPRPVDDQAINRIIREMEQRTTPVAARYINPFATWLRGTVAQMAGDNENALQAIETVIGLTGATGSLVHQRDVLRQATASGRPAEPQVFIVLESGLGPALREVRLDLILPYLGLTAIAFPEPVYYPDPWRGFSVTTSGSHTEGVDVISMDAMFSAAFRARYGLIVARTLASYAAKEVGSRAAVINTSGDAQIVAYILTGIYKYATTRADTRVWRARGNHFQVAVIPMPEDGQVEIRLRGRDRLEQVSFPPGKTNNGFIYIQAPSPQLIQTSQQAFDIY